MFIKPIAWNRKRDASVVLSKIKEFTISVNSENNYYSVKGWYNKDNYFLFGDDFVSKTEARKFLEAVHSQYQGG
ncbi:MAG: hypothetical protein WC346_10100 [Methanogenium sp.]|jgi:hypothetical protein